MPIISKYKVVVISVGLVFVVYFIIETIKNKLWKFICIKTINYFDKLLFFGMMTEIFLIYNYVTMFMFWKNSLFILAALNFIVIVVRLVVIDTSIKKADKKKISVYSIYDLYKGKVKNKDLILLEENAIDSSDKDLLDITLFANGVETTLLQCSPKETFVISLIGKWGSGKTSIINIIKEKINKSDSAVMEIFNPWQYDDKYSLFKGFYNYLFKALGENFGYVNYKEIFSRYQNIIFGIVKKGFDISLENTFEKINAKDIEEIKKSINDYILLNNKKIIVVIDDIDRLDKEQVLLIFKIVKTMFNFNNVIYVLCYDEVRINKVFEKELNIDSNYLDKIIQNKIIVPKTDNYILKNIGIKSISNVLENYNINVADKKRLSEVLDIIFKSFVDLREVIRFINSISVSIKSVEIINIDVIDLIALEYIKYVNLELYYNIANNSYIFVSDDVEYASDYDYLLPETYNNLVKEKYSNLFKENDVYINLLSKVFPYVQKYKDKQEFRNSHLIYFGKEERKAGILEKRCFNGRYFRVYFSVRQNFFTQLNQLFTNFITNVNNGKTLKDEFDNLILSVNSDDHNVLFELIDMRMSEIDDQEEIFYYLLSSINRYENGAKFLGLNSRDRIQIVLASIIKNNKEKSNQYIDDILKEDLILLDKVLYWVKPDKYGDGKEYEATYNYGKSILISKLEEIIKMKYKIFDKSNYTKHYCWLFYRNFEEKDKEKAREYLTSQLNKENIVRALGECVSEWVGTGVSYEYNEENAKLLFDLAKVEKIVKKLKIEELNDDQKLVIELYKNKNEKERNISLDFNNL
jgi:hypothetical protein